MTSFPNRLREGYHAFRAGRLASERDRYRRMAIEGQHPEIMIVACCDSRAAPETIFDAGPGELFVHRNVANLIPPCDPSEHQHGTSAALEFGVVDLAVKHLVVIGHGRCGGIAAYLAGRSAAETDFIGRWIALIKPAAGLVADDPADKTGRQLALEFASIRNGIANLRTFPWIAAAEGKGALALHGAWFDIATGDLQVLDPGSGAFAPIASMDI